MPSITIRNISTESHRRLRIRAAQNGRSMQEEVKAMIDAESVETKKLPMTPASNWVDEMRARIKEFGYVDFEPATIDEYVDFPDFSGKEFQK